MGGLTMVHGGYFGSSQKEYFLLMDGTLGGGGVLRVGSPAPGTLSKGGGVAPGRPTRRNYKKY